MQICIAKRGKLQSKISKISSIVLDLLLSRKIIFIIGTVAQVIRPAQLAEIQHRAHAMCNSSSKIFREQGISWVARSLGEIQLGTCATRVYFFFFLQGVTQVGVHIVGEEFRWRLFHGWVAEAYDGIWRFMAGDIIFREWISEAFIS